MRTSVTLTILAACTATFPALAHDGRRFEVQVIDGQLRAQGVNLLEQTNGSGMVIDPLGPRLFYSALHDHWTNNPSPAVTAASADLPGYDFGLGTTALTGASLTWELTDAYKWVSPPLDGVMVVPGTVPSFIPLAPEETIFVTYNGNTVSTDAPGVLTLVDDFNGSNGDDLDLSYDIATEPVDTLFVLESVLSTNAAGIQDSATVYTVFAPDGTGPVERLHFASLFLEEKLGTVPEPAFGRSRSPPAQRSFRRTSSQSP